MAPGFRTAIWLVGVYIFLHFSSAKGADVTLQSHCQFRISVFWYGEPGPFVLQPDKPNPIGLKTNGSTSFSVPSGVSNITFWACNLVDKPCNAGNTSATVAAISLGDETNSYKVSAEVGYNLPLSIMALRPFECPTITCTANLTDCPADLRVTDSNGNITACRSPADSGESTPLIDGYLAMMKGCLEEVPSTCDAGVYLVITFCDK